MLSKNFRSMAVGMALLVFTCGACSSGGGSGTTALTYTGFRPIGDESIMSDPALWGELNTHDPSVFKDGDVYYVFSTDASFGNVHKLGVQIRKSSDLVTWEYVGTAFADFEKDCAEVITYANLDVSAHNGLWAPDIMKVGDKYRLYFSASTFGSTQSCIALAEADSIEGPYVYKGIVVKSEANTRSEPNCIDPAMCYGRDGRLYISYGSFFGGIFIAELDESTGFLNDAEEEPARIAGSRGASVEGSYIQYIPETDYYYLFVSYGSLSSDYNMRVGRSKDVTGPFLDANGNDMAFLNTGNEDRVGVKIMGGYTFVSEPGVAASKGVMAPGHNSELADGTDYYLVHHARTYALPDYWFGMDVHKFFINGFGWPVVAPMRYHGEATGEPSALPDGTYAVIRHLTDSNSESRNSESIVLADGIISGAFEGNLEQYDGNKVRIEIDGVMYDGVALRQYDAERSQDVQTFTVMSENGLCIWGSTV